MAALNTSTSIIALCFLLMVFPNSVIGGSAFIKPLLEFDWSKLLENEVFIITVSLILVIMVVVGYVLCCRNRESSRYKPSNENDDEGSHDHSVQEPVCKIENEKEKQPLLLINQRVEWHQS